MSKNNKNQETEQVVKNEEIKYSKKQLVSSKKYAFDQDLLQVLLNDDSLYTLEEVESKLNEYKKRSV